jgi:hypothetical protein
MDFEKTQIFAQNPWVSAYDFTKNHQFEEKLNKAMYFLVVTSILRIGYT